MDWSQSAASGENTRKTTWLQIAVHVQQDFERIKEKWSHLDLVRSDLWNIKSPIFDLYILAVVTLVHEIQIMNFFWK